EVQLQLIEEAPYGFFFAHRDDGELGAEQGAAHRRQLAVTREVLAGRRFGLVEERVLEERGCRLLVRARAEPHEQRVADVLRVAELDIAADYAPGVVVEPAAEVRRGADLRHEAIEARRERPPRTRIGDVLLGRVAA